MSAENMFYEMFVGKLHDIFSLSQESDELQMPQR